MPSVVVQPAVGRGARAASGAAAAGGKAASEAAGDSGEPLHPATRATATAQSSRVVDLKRAGIPLSYRPRVRSLRSAAQGGPSTAPMAWPYLSYCDAI